MGRKTICIKLHILTVLVLWENFEELDARSGLFLEFKLFFESLGLLSLLYLVYFGLSLRQQFFLVCKLPYSSLVLLFIL